MNSITKGFVGLTIIQGWILFVFAFAKCSCQDAQKGVDLVTKLSNDLITSIFKELGTPNEDIVIGPFGLASNLAMILEASEGKTQREILDMLNVSPDDLQDIRQGFKAYCELFLEHSGSAEAAGSFNSASITSTFKLLPSYRDTLTKYYCSNITEILNNSDNTTALELESDAGVMSHWRDYERLAVYTFLSHQSVMPFRTRDNNTINVPMIPQVGFFKTKRWESTDVVLIPLQAKLVHLLIIVPDNIKKYERVLRKLSAISLPNFVESLPREEVEVFLPQLTAVSKSLDLTRSLLRQGIQQVFDSKKANLDRASDQSGEIFLKNIQQDAYFSTSFVSVNSVSGMSSILGFKRRSKRETRKLYVDRPFLFFILHKDTQLSLLAGKIERPSQVPF